MMNINIRYKDNTSFYVDPSILDELISADKIRMFQRSDGWTVVGTDPVRGWGGAYDGPDRRTGAIADRNQLDYLTAELCVSNWRKSLIPAGSYQKLFESIPGLFVILDTEYNIAAANDAFLNATMTKRENLLGHNFFEIFPDNPNDINATGERNMKSSFNRVLSTGASDVMAVQKYDIRQPASSGGTFEERYWSQVTSPVLNAENKVEYLIIRVEDVTDYIRLKMNVLEKDRINEELREHVVQMESDIYTKAREMAEINFQLKDAMVQVNQALGDKDSLMREMHHRVKNNLSIISSLLTLQLENISGKKTDDILNDSISRINTMTAIHEKLYRADDLTNINLKGYFEDLGNSLKTCFLSDLKPITYVTEISDDIELSVEMMVPLGLIFNELYTNSVKYAFNGKDQARISTKIWRNKNRVTFEYKDNGSGVDINTLMKRDSFGLQLIRLFADQMSGELKWQNDEGLKCTISFNI